MVTSNNWNASMLDEEKIIVILDSNGSGGILLVLYSAFMIMEYKETHDNRGSWVESAILISSI